jgi:hypothetical protein
MFSLQTIFSILRRIHQESFFITRNFCTFVSIKTLLCPNIRLCNFIKNIYPTERFSILPNSYRVFLIFILYIFPFFNTFKSILEIPIFFDVSNESVKKNITFSTVSASKLLKYFILFVTNSTHSASCKGNISSFFLHNILTIAIFLL